MPPQDADVSTVVRLEPRLDRAPEEMLRAGGGLTVELEGERRVRLDPDDRRSPGFAQVLDGLRQQRLPVYLEVDPETSSITRLLIQGDPNATLTDSAASIFYLWGSVTDPNYVQTNQVLAFYRLQLQNRSIQQGPPPYAHCP